ncbi:MAG TPA: TraR/DksA family transcriptional regulator [Pirellulaceae bacterium]|jgi:DnaK suppressor protein|nr:TraR/DksA family transcriptional regulator [Pirellulaceae bacterium]
MRRHDVIREMRASLLRRRGAIRQSLDLARSQLCNKRDRDVGDSVDFALDAECHEVSSQLAEVESTELAQIDVALQRMAAGDYGACGDCGRNIPMARLRALPYATLCVKCQRDQDTGGSRNYNSTSFAEPGDNDLLLNGNGAGLS